MPRCRPMLTLFVLCRRRAFRYTPGILERNNGLDSRQEENVDVSPVSPVPPDLAKTSSSEWNSSDDLAGPSSEHEESSPVEPLSPPPVPPKTLGLAQPDLPGVHPPLLESPSQSGPRNLPRNGSSLLSHNTLRRWIETPPEHRFSSDASSKSGSSDQDRNDLSASESDERVPDDADCPGLADVVLPTTYFSVDNCMTDTYRAQYHRRPAQFTRAEEHTSSGESDAEGRRLPADLQLTEPRTRPEPGTAVSAHVAPCSKHVTDPKAVSHRVPDGEGHGPVEPGHPQRSGRARLPLSSGPNWDPVTAEAFEALMVASRPSWPSNQLPKRLKSESPR